MSKTVLHVNKVKKVYGKKGENQSHALKDVSFSIEEGEFVESWVPQAQGRQHY
ncbi:hypothetical protein BG07_5778 (plasmid) [Bacillus pseudomycoides]|nr:hypothetical protein DJ92_5690 [Bacillus pseudomycoides]AJI14483.1 hypothetical protein BG07_5778 [Bacillus pseudomycoides]